MIDTVAAVQPADHVAAYRVELLPVCAPANPSRLKPLAFIIAANFLFGILLGGMPSLGIPAMGLIAAIFGLTFLSALAGSEFKFIEVLILAIVLAVGSWAAFVWGLNLQFQVWPSFISG